MVEVEFIYEGVKTNIQCNENDKMKKIFEKYVIKIEKKVDELVFLYSGKKLDNNELTFNQIVNSEDKENKKICILIYDENEKPQNKKEKLKKSTTVICPKCQQDIYFKFQENKIALYECKNGHEMTNILLSEFEKTQFIDESKVICDKCKQNKSNAYHNKFYICLDCHINLCPLCQSSQENSHKSHNIIDYDEKNIICFTHKESYNSYCENCKKDICLQCEKEHKMHKIIYYGDIIPNTKLLKNKINELRNKIDEYKKHLNEIIIKLNNLMEYYEIYYNINDNIINNYGKNNRNYCTLQNVNYINMNIDNVIENLNILNQKNLNQIFNESIEIYDGMINIEEKSKSMILSQEDMNKISNWLYPIYKNNVELKLIYRRGNDMSYQNFHQKCDNKGPTIVVCKSNNEKFGGYSNINWEAAITPIRKFEYGPFIFSITKNRKYEYLNNGNHSIYLEQNHGPDFSWDFTFNTDKGMKACACFPKISDGYAYSSESIIGDGYAQSLEVDEVEVFQVLKHTKYL